jgi:hypothetical protein
VIFAAAHSARRLPHSGPARRGVAEIELLMVIPLLLSIIFLLGAMLILGPARLLNIVKPNEMAYRDATTADDPQLTDVSEPEIVPDPMLQINQSLPPLPNRVHAAESDQSETIKVGSIALPTFTLVNKAAYTSPTWAYSSWPDSSDASVLEDWLNQYADQSKETVSDPLMLAPAWPP